ncbi:MAG: hypothetical protein ACD_65C00292G0002 [uncultured bacterium]|nr:MAG: hypothetical protein ACD_65C00292G0002 [uncultured bacterium]KKT02923.1 MAG: hypothetical protein UV80_C0001G0025 [Candidatus Peregrinibacteria bacterium GW2011_GWF2_43_17]KKT20377.1 MAG: hypothetical protein UW03_C0005G0012 [Candidatus Peregrinibacteria bacterium GW2011_GWA2_43_8]HAU40268.1 hypothetical protein [Candidatus Peregrinibacteria bacterium]
MAEESAQPIEQPINNNYEEPESREKGKKTDELDTILRGADALEKIAKDHPSAADGAYANFMLGIYRTEAWHKVEDGWNKTPDNIKALMISRWAKYLPLGPLSAAPEGIRFLVEAGLLEAPKDTSAEQIGEESLKDTKIMALIATAIVAIFAPEAILKIAKLLPKLMAISKLRKTLNESSRTAISKERISGKEIDRLRQEIAQKITTNNNEHFASKAA